MLRRGGAAIVVLVLFLLLPSAAEAAPSYVSYAGCSAGGDAAPSHTCEVGERLGAFFELTGRTEAQFETCIARVGGPYVCTKEQLATALTPMVLPFRLLQVGSYEVIWRVEGQQVGSWMVNTVSQPLPFTRNVASEALRYKVLAESPEARFLTPSGPLCPRIYRRSRPHSVCFAEYRTGRLFHLRGYAVGGKGDRLSLSFRVGARWFRRWVSCPLYSIPGVLRSNNNCGYHQPQNDEDLLRGQALAAIRAGRRVPSVRWTFAESAGLGALGFYRVSKQGNSYLYRNSVGDAFRYHP